MQQATKILTVDGIDVQVVRKDIKHLYLSVYPPDGQVRVSAPRRMSEDNVHLAIVSKINWIKKRKEKFKGQAGQTQRRYVSGESHYFFGKRYRLQVIERQGKHKMVLMESDHLQMFVKPGTKTINKEKLLNQWYRTELNKRIPALLDKWQPVIGKNVSEWGIKKMKTRWGSCNVIKKRIWLNLELAKKPPECLEYVFVHEMVHLLERNHNTRFKGFMDKFLPQWRTFSDTLSSAPLRHKDWLY